MNNRLYVENIGKRYRLGVIGRQTLADELRYRWMTLRGRDPIPHMGKVDRSPGTDLSGRMDPEHPGTFWSLRGITFSVAPGEVLGIIGANGAGKSTLLKILARITEPTEGRARIAGRMSALLEVGTGFHPELTGRENVFLNGAILGMNEREIRRKFDAIVQFAETGDFIDTPVKRYSSGMRTRLAFAVAAHLEPDVLLLDEVLSVGDAAFQTKCAAKMRELAGQGRAVVLVSHRFTSITEMCTRTLWMDRGMIRKDGEPESVINAYLSESSATGGERHWPAGWSSPRFRGLTVYAIRILNDARQVVAAWRENQPVTIEAVFRAEPETSGFRMGIEIATAQGSVIAAAFTRTLVAELRETQCVRAVIAPGCLSPGRRTITLLAANASCPSGVRLGPPLGIEILATGDTPCSRGVVQLPVEWDIRPHPRSSG